MPKGTIARIITDRGGFGYIVPEDRSKDVHFNLRALPEARIGLKVTYELEVPEPARGPHAATIKVDDGSAPTAPTPAASPPTRSGELSVKIEVGTAKSIEVEEMFGDADEVRKVRYLRLPVLVSLSRDGDQHVKDMEVLMEPNGVHKTRNGWDVFNSNHKGEVYFQVLVPEDTEDTIITVRVGGKNYSERWEKTPTPVEPLPTDAVTTTVTEPAVTPAPPEPKPLKVEKTGPDPNGTYTFLLTDGEPDKLATVDGNVAVFVWNATEGNDPPTTPGPLIFDKDGRLEVRVRVMTKGQKGEIFFCSEGQNTKPPRYVRST